MQVIYSAIMGRFCAPIPRALAETITRASDNRRRATRPPRNRDVWRREARIHPHAGVDPCTRIWSRTELEPDVE
jgi:hypothetical protein